MKIISGDLIQLALAGNFDVIVHGCNCQNVMGAGIAKTIRLAFPEAYMVDAKTRRGDKKKLGTLSWANVIRGPRELIVVNAYTQFDYRGSGIKVDYGAIKTVFLEIKKRFSGKRIGYPKIGAGLAGGSWTIIASVIDEILQGEDHSLVVLPTDKQ